MSQKTSRLLMMWTPLAGFVILVGYLMGTDHLFQALPFLFLAACPLMHFFMHRDHGGHGDRADKE